MNLVTMPAMKDLVKLAGISLKGRKRDKNLFVKKHKVMPKFTEATVTPAVRQVFEMVFGEQMRKEGEEEDEAKKKGKARVTRCGMCDNCLKPDCGVCR